MLCCQIVCEMETFGENVVFSCFWCLENKNSKSNNLTFFKNFFVLGLKEFTHQYTLMRHIPTHTDERKYTCRVCGKAFRQMSTLSQHRAIHSADRPYICELCDKTFNRVSTLISHRKTHTNEKPHQCHLCHKAFHQKGNLRNHIFTHTNERPYKCDLCNRGFNQMSNLMCHKLKVSLKNWKRVSDNCFEVKLQFFKLFQAVLDLLLKKV